MLTEFKQTNQPRTNALIALMCFHASRFDARQTSTNDFVLYENQNDNLWNKELIEKGKYFLNISAEGNILDSYHLEAGIAFLHCEKKDTLEKWQSILRYYNLLLQINYSPTVALNRTYALYKANGKGEALIEAEKMRLENNHFYFTLLGELYTNIDNSKAKENFQRALLLAKTQTDKRTIQNKITALLKQH